MEISGLMMNNDAEKVRLKLPKLELDLERCHVEREELESRKSLEEKA
jgi:hypothetical protein